MAVIGVLAIGMTLVIVAGHIDLSVGSLAGLTGGIAAILQVWYGWNTFAVIIIAILVGAIIGLWQGYWVAYRAVPAFIVTLGGMLIFRGILVGVSQGRTIAPLDESFRMFGTSYLPFLYGYVLVVISIAMMFIFTMRRRKRRHELGLLLPSSSID